MMSGAPTGRVTACSDQRALQRAWLVGALLASSHLTNPIRMHLSDHLLSRVGQRYVRRRTPDKGISAGMRRLVRADRAGRRDQAVVVAVGGHRRPSAAGVGAVPS